MSMMDEMVLPVLPMSLSHTVVFGECFLAKHFPEMLQRPQALDVERLVDEVLPREGTRVYPVRDMESHGVTKFNEDDDSVIIELREVLYEALFDPYDRSRVFALSTLVHEVAHALRHMPQFLEAHLLAKQRGRRPDLNFALHRRANLKAYEDPEWQAYRIGSVLVAPPTAIRMLPNHSVSELAEVFEISVSNMQAHMKRLAEKGFVNMKPPVGTKGGFMR